MKIIHINSVYGMGSTGKILESIHVDLLKSGHDSLVITGRAHPKYNVETNTDTIMDMYHPCKVIVDAIPSLIFDTHGLHSKKNTVKTIEMIEKFQPDVIHLHNLHGFYINYKLLFEYLNKTNIKIVWTLHDCWSFTGYCSYYSYNQCEQWKSGCRQCQYKNTYPYRFLSHSKKNFKLKKSLFLNNTNLHFVTPSNWLRDEMKYSFLSDCPVMTINNDVNLDMFYEEENNNVKNQFGNKKILLAVSNIWNKQKGFDEYVALSKKISDDYQIVMIGVTSNQTKFLKKYGIVGMSKMSSIAELRNWYSSAHFFINLTLEDNYPTVNLEAISCQLRVLGYDSGGNKETIQCYGECVKKHDLDTLVHLIEENKNYSYTPKQNNMFIEYKKLYGIQ